MKMLTLACPGVSANSRGLTTVEVLPFPDGAGVVPPPGAVSGSVPVDPLILDRDIANLIV